jgi:hypothetical protein
LENGFLECTCRYLDLGTLPAVFMEWTVRKITKNAWYHTPLWKNIFKVTFEFLLEYVTGHMQKGLELKKRSEKSHEHLPLNIQVSPFYVYRKCKADIVMSS